MSKNVQSLPKHEMPSLDFSDYTLTELAEIRKRLDNEIQSRRAKEVDELRAKVTEAAQTLGVSVEEIMGLPASGKRITKHPRGRQPARYRGPGGEEWSGRGPSPRWMKPLLEAGKKKEDFLIK